VFVVVGARGLDDEAGDGGIGDDDDDTGIAGPRTDCVTGYPPG
jgi:hypothetical protein